MATIELPDDLLALETAAWNEIQAGRLTLDTANAVQDAITRHAAEAGIGRYDLEMAVKRAVRHGQE
ncbi:hypothetical protein SGFS_012670 [Streptomyces graminofaciens]|uniref:Uncharacterized protein n=1 Tax=Streptomyces graminofaciens TaxID=68212 RepID=A0ABN5VAP8_9ACTN|nr:hypothetical protein [Streptomyces graminofaciens]BBC29973.1 hypothetical protein SGFS_012670 [Streptomyces graminofaciens]